MQRECVGEHTGGGGYVHGVGIPESEALCLQVSLRSSFLKTIMDGSAVSLGGRQFHKREVWKRNNDFVVVFFFFFFYGKTTNLQTCECAHDIKCTYVCIEKAARKRQWW